VYAGTSPDNVRECISVIRDQLAKLRDQRVADDELRLAKEHIKGNLTLALESTSSRMIRLGRSEFSLGRNLTTEEIESRVDQVTSEEIQALAAELLAEDQLGLCVLGPVDETQLDFNRSAA
ncbi:MAG: insulinase family protein, partial [Candidatus Eremiobacteraeota bacterium]|nr:insulinase family protein [Candidatus Eremiobacteraeota bacterium]